MTLTKSVFGYEMPSGFTYSAHWYPNNPNDHHSGDFNRNRKFQVSIFRGGGYQGSYWTDNRICDKNSREFINRYLKKKL